MAAVLHDSELEQQPFEIHRIVGQQTDEYGQVWLHVEWKDTVIEYPSGTASRLLKYFQADVKKTVIGEFMIRIEWKQNLIPIQNRLP